MCRPQNVYWDKQGRDPQGSSGVSCQQLSCSAHGQTALAASPQSQPPGAPYPLLQRQVKGSAQNSPIQEYAATTLQSALWLLCLVWEQGQGGTAALGTPVSPWCAVLRAPLHKPDWAQPQKCLWPELLHLQGLRSQLPSELFPLRHPSTSSRASWALLRSKPLALCRRHGGTA